MFSFAILIGIYSYLIFVFGLIGLISKPAILFLTLFYLFSIIFFYRKKLRGIFKLNLENYKKITVENVLIILISTQAAVNLIGVLGPEISFDALWYHLTLPKLYIMQNYVSYISGNLLFYSTMPKLTEILYIPLLMFGGETSAKLLHFIFGLLILIVIYKLSFGFLSKLFSLLAAVIFYSNLVVGWESITAYIDLSRTFYEVLAILGFLIWYEKRNIKWLIISAICLGLAISTKVIALESLLIFIVLLTAVGIFEKIKMIKQILIFAFFSFLIPLPWFIFALINTGNPFYPFFDRSIDIGTNFVMPNLINFFKDFISLFLYSSDPISPIYLLSIPILILSFSKAKTKIKLLYLYTVLALLLWYVTPRIGGGRFTLPYLPVFSIISSYSISKIKDVKLRNILIILVIFVAAVSVSYRLVANYKFFPVILEKQQKSEFLAKNLNFSFGDFYDTDGYFKKHLKSTDTVLLYGFHNLYYVDFNFIDSSWVKKGDRFNYIAVQNGVTPKRFSNWKLVYYNNLTKVKLYSMEGKTWHY